MSPLADLKLVDVVHNLNQEVDVHSQENTRLNAQVKLLTQQVSEAEAKADASHSALEAVEAMLSGTNEELTATLAEKSASDAESARLRAELDAATAAHQQAEADEAALAQKLADMSAENSNMLALREALKAKEGEADALALRCASVSRDLKKANIVITYGAARYANMKQRVAALEAEVSSARDAVGAAEAELVQLREEFHLSELALSRRVTEQELVIDASTKELVDLHATVGEQEAQLAAVRDAVTGSEVVVEEQADVLQQAMAFLAQAARLLDGARHVNFVLDQQNLTIRDAVGDRCDNLGDESLQFSTSMSAGAVVTALSQLLNEGGPRAVALISELEAAIEKGEIADALLARRTTLLVLMQSTASAYVPVDGEAALQYVKVLMALLPYTYGEKLKAWQQADPAREDKTRSRTDFDDVVLPAGMVLPPQRRLQVLINLVNGKYGQFKDFLRDN